MLAKAKPAGASEQSPRDRVFDMVMTRFEVMAPYKPALRRISADLCCHPAEAAQLLPSSLASQYWMLAGAGAKLDGPGAGFASRGSRRSTPRCFASGSTIIRRGSIAPWRRSTAGSRPAKSGSHASNPRAKASAASLAGSCRADGNGALRATRPQNQHRRRIGESRPALEGSQSGSGIVVVGTGEILRSFARQLRVDRVVRRRCVRIVGNVERPAFESRPVTGSGSAAAR